MMAFLIRFTILFPLIFWAAPQARAENEPTPENFDPTKSYSPYSEDIDWRPAEQLLDPASLGSYRQSLAEDDCDSAFALLANAFAEAYPLEPNPASSGRMSRRWIVYVANGSYQELSFCIDMRRLREARVLIAREGLTIERLNEEKLFRSIPDWPELSLHSAFTYLYFLAKDDYAPALLALARLSEEGEVVRFTPEYQYYILIRAQNLGQENPDLAALIARAAALLDADRRAALDRQAKTGKFDRDYGTFE